MVSRNTISALTLSVALAGCQLITKDSTPALYEVRGMMLDGVAKHCTVKADDYRDTNGARLTGGGINIAVDGSGWVTGRIEDPVQRLYGQVWYNLYTKSVTCSGGGNNPLGLKTGWDKLTEVEATRLLKDLRSTSLQSPRRSNVEKSAEQGTNILVRIGSGPIELPAEGKAGYKRYLENRPANQNSVMITTSSGASGGFAWNRDLEIAKSDAMRICMRNAKAKGDVADCAIYDINGEIVWDFSAPTTETRVSDQTVTERLKKVQELLDQGLISETDASVKRAEILESL